MGYIIWGNGSRKPALEERHLAGGRFAVLAMGSCARPRGPLARARAGRAARRLWESGVRRAVFPVDFPYTELFLRQGVAPVETLPLRRTLAAPLTRRRLEALGRSPTEAVVGLSGARMSRELWEAARTLALSYRYGSFSGSLRNSSGV